MAFTDDTSTHAIQNALPRLDEMRRWEDAHGERMVWWLGRAFAAAAGLGRVEEIVAAETCLYLVNLFAGEDPTPAEWEQTLPDAIESGLVFAILKGNVLPVAHPLPGDRGPTGEGA
mgnify:CR=1 FL=1